MTHKTDISRRRLCAVGCILVILLLAHASRAQDWASPPGGGSGSYALTVPAAGTTPDGGQVTLVPPAVGPNLNPAKTYTAKVPTNDWWTPLVWVDPNDLAGQPANQSQQFLSWAVFSDPLVFQPEARFRHEGVQSLHLRGGPRWREPGLVGGGEPQRVRHQ